MSGRARRSVVASRTVARSQASKQSLRDIGEDELFTTSATKRNNPRPDCLRFLLNYLARKKETSCVVVCVPLNGGPVTRVYVTFDNSHHAVLFRRATRDGIERHPSIQCTFKAVDQPVEENVAGVDPAWRHGVYFLLKQSRLQGMRTNTDQTVDTVYDEICHDTPFSAVTCRLLTPAETARLATPTTATPEEPSRSAAPPRNNKPTKKRAASKTARKGKKRNQLDALEQERLRLEQVTRVEQELAEERAQMEQAAARAAQELAEERYCLEQAAARTTQALAEERAARTTQALAEERAARTTQELAEERAARAYQKKEQRAVQQAYAERTFPVLCSGAKIKNNLFF